MRQLLALIALLTGLAALAEPVRAAETGIATVRVEQGVSSHAQAAPARVRLDRAAHSRTPQQTFNPLRRIFAAAPAVILQADRARE